MKFFFMFHTILSSNNEIPYNNKTKDAESKQKTVGNESTSSKNINRAFDLSHMSFSLS